MNSSPWGKLRSRIRLALSRRMYGDAQGFLSIVFSKDRPLQLHGLVESFLENCTDAGRIVVIYKATDADFLRAYRSLFSSIRKAGVVGILQEIFRDDVLWVINSAREERLLFLVDDIVTIRAFTLRDTARFATDESVVALRLGETINYCYTQSKGQPPPPLKQVEGISDAAMFRWKWQDGVHDWAYPLSVDGHIFSTREMNSLARGISFHSPNSFEAGLQKYNPEFSKRMGVCWDTPRLVNIACNRVQHEFTNRSGSQSPEALLRAWNDGYRLDWRSLQGLDARSPHIEIELPLVKAGREV